jgi:hypothetical protein
MSDLDVLLSDLNRSRVVTISSSSTFAKSHALQIISQRLLEEEKEVWYIDLDLQYSSALSVTGQRISKHLHLFNPSEEDLLNSFIELVSNLGWSGDANRGMVVLDSVNTLQLLLRDRDYRTGSLKANHEASILVSLLEKFATKRNSTLLLGNLMRLRPGKEAQDRTIESSWEEQLSGGRMIRQKSDVILSVSRGSKSILKEGLGTSHLLFKVDALPNEVTANNWEQGRTYSVEMTPVLL